MTSTDLVVVVPARRGVVTDPWKVAAIAARVEFYSRPRWRRVGRRPVLRWASHVVPSKIDMPCRVPSSGEAA